MYTSLEVNRLFSCERRDVGMCMRAHINDAAFCGSTM